MSYAPGAPAAVWSLDLDTGSKLTLMALWSWADHDDQREARACTVWTKAREGMTQAQSLRSAIAEQTGQTDRAVRQHLSKLRTRGLADASGRCASLTPAWQPRHHDGAVDPKVADTETARRDTQVAAGDTRMASGDTSASLQLNPPVPSLPPSPGEAAHTTPSESTTPDDDTNENRTHEANPPEGRQDVVGHALAASAVVGQAPRVTLPAAYPEHVRAKHAQVTQSSHAAPPGNSNGSPAGGHSPGELGPEVWRAIEDHDRGRWAQSLMGANWVTSLAQAMDDLNLDTDRVLAVLDAWSQQSSGGVPPGMPSRRELWWAGGGRGKLVARPWLLRTLEATRAKLRVVSADEEYERALADAYR